MQTVYILYSLSLDKYYVGVTSGRVEERLNKHLANHSGFTGKAKDWRIVYQEHYKNKSESLRREREIKSWKSRKKLEQLCSSTE